MFHIDTGIGVQITRDFVQETARRFGWKLTTIRSKDDCGMDYDAIVRKHGFPGPYGHQFMYRRLRNGRSNCSCGRPKRTGWIRLFSQLASARTRVCAGWDTREQRSTPRAHKCGPIRSIGGRGRNATIIWMSTRSRAIQ